MKVPQRPITTVLAGLLFSGAVLLGATQELASQWRTGQITIDGQASEWTGLEHLGKLPLSGAFVNDGESLYVCLVSSDPDARAAIRGAGLILWIDAAGKTKKQVGFHFPVGGASFGRGRRGDGGMWGGQPPDPQSMRDATPQTVEILGPGKDDTHRVNLQETRGLEARVNTVEGQVVWELRLPLAGLQDWMKIGAPGSVIGVRVETAKMGMPQMPGGMGGFGGRGGGRGGMGGGMGRPGGRGFTPPKPFSEWFKVKLATQAHVPTLPPQ